MVAVRRRRTIFEIFEELRSQMDRFLEELLGEEDRETPLCDVAKRELKPLTHITETEDEVIVTIDLPYVRKEDIKLSATENTLKIEAPSREKIRFSPWGPYKHETEFECFRKTVRLPVNVEPEKAKAKFKDGILQVSLPKKIHGYRVPIE